MIGFAVESLFKIAKALIEDNLNAASYLMWLRGVVWF